MRTERLDISNNRSNQNRRRLLTMSSQGFDKALLSEFLSCRVERFGYAVGVECECVSGGEWTLSGRALPFLEEAQHGARRVEPFQGTVVPEQERGEMPAIYITQALHSVVVLGKKQGGVGIVRRILVKCAIYQLQEALRLIQRDCALAAQVRLQIGHQKSSCDSFSCNVTDHQAEPLPA